MLGLKSSNIFNHNLFDILESDEVLEVSSLDDEELVDELPKKIERKMCIGHLEDMT